MYLECPHHEEVVRAEEESGQHHYDLPTIRFNWLRRGHWFQYIDRFPGTLSREFDHLSYFERNTFRFLREHRECGEPRIVSEHGEVFEIHADTLAELVSEDGDWPGS